MIKINVLILSRLLRDGEAVSEYCKNLANYLVDSGDQVFMVGFNDGSDFDVRDEVRVKKIDVNFEAENIYDWAMIMNNEMKRASREVFEQEGFDLVHVNDWVCVPSGVTISNYLEKPLVATIHSTENERGFEGQHSAVISDMEWKGGYEADKIIANNEGTKNSLLFDLDVPGQKIEKISPFSEEWQEETRRVYREVKG